MNKHLIPGLCLAAAVCVTGASAREGQGVREATSVEAAQVQALFDARERGRPRASIGELTVSRHGWVCGNARVVREGIASSQPFVSNPTLGILILPFHIAGWDDQVGIRTYDENCMGGVARR